MLGWLLGAGVAYSVLKGGSKIAEGYGKKAYPALSIIDYENEKMIHGFGEFDEEEINKIAARCGIRPNKYKVLPLFGYEECIDFVKENDGNVDDFIKTWVHVVKCQEDVQKREIHKKYADRYHRLVDRYENVFSFSDTETTTFTVNHWYSLTMDEHYDRMSELYDDTYLGQLATDYPVLRGHLHPHGKRTEIWTVKKRNHINPHSPRADERIWKGFYNTCCRYLGYSP